jgi:hypothetical protein
MPKSPVYNNTVKTAKRRIAIARLHAAFFNRVISLRIVAPYRIYINRAPQTRASAFTLQRWKTVKNSKEFLTTKAQASATIGVHLIFGWRSTKYDDGGRRSKDKRGIKRYYEL